MEKAFLFAAIAAAVLIGAMFALIQPVQNAQSTHTTLGNLLCKIAGFDPSGAQTTGTRTFDPATNTCIPLPE